MERVYTVDQIREVVQKVLMNHSDLSTHHCLILTDTVIDKLSKIKFTQPPTLSPCGLTTCDTCDDYPCHEYYGPQAD